MSLGERVWDTLTVVLQMKDKIATLTDAVKSQQGKLEELTGRMIRVETVLALLTQREGRHPRLPDGSER